MNESDSDHLGFLARIPVPLKIGLGTVAEINLLSMICANFGAFITKPTILMIFDTNLLHYQGGHEPAYIHNAMPSRSTMILSADFTARCYASAVLAMGLCLCLSVSVCHKSEFY